MVPASVPVPVISRSSASPGTHVNQGQGEKGKTNWPLAARVTPPVAMPVVVCDWRLTAVSAADATRAIWTTAIW